MPAKAPAAPEAAAIKISGPTVKIVLSILF